jgi:hypothetical protein
MCRISSRRLQRWPYGMLYDIVSKNQNIGEWFVRSGFLTNAFIGSL